MKTEVPIGSFIFIPALDCLSILPMLVLPLVVSCMLFCGIAV